MESLVYYDSDEENGESEKNVDEKGDVNYDSVNMDMSEEEVDLPVDPPAVVSLLREKGQLHGQNEDYDVSSDNAERVAYKKQFYSIEKDESILATGQSNEVQFKESTNECATFTIKERKKSGSDQEHDNRRLVRSNDDLPKTEIDHHRRHKHRSRHRRRHESRSNSDEDDRAGRRSKSPSLSRRRREGRSRSRSRSRSRDRYSHKYHSHRRHSRSPYRHKHRKRSSSSSRHRRTRSSSDESEGVRDYKSFGRRRSSTEIKGGVLDRHELRERKLAAMGFSTQEQILRVSTNIAEIHAAKIEAQVAKAKEVTGIDLPKYYNAGAIDPLKYAEQIKQRQILWGTKSGGNLTTKSSNKLAPLNPGTNSVVGGSSSSFNKWECTNFGDKDANDKFRRLMGIKNSSSGNSSSTVAPNKDFAVKDANSMFVAQEKEYEIARATTHTHKGLGLGFSALAE